MSNSSGASFVDRSLVVALTRGRLPSTLSGLAVVLIVSLGFDWPFGVGPLLISIVAAAHAIYQRVSPRAGFAFGIAIDLPVVIYLTWIVGATEVVVAFAMVMLVIVANVTVDRARIALFAIVVGSLALAVTFPAQTDWMDPTLHTWLARLLPFYAVAVALYVLRNVSQELRRSEVQRGYVVGTVAHELRNDLTPVVGMSMVLLDELRESGRADLVEMATVIASQAMAASATVDDLLTLARLDRESLGLSVTTVDLQKTVATVLANADLRRVDVVTRGGSNGALGDPTRVGQIVRNLCTNAQRYGGDAIRIEIVDGGDGETHLLVTDDGPGIPDDEVMTVFEPFGRGAAGRRNASSVGLGLWIGRQLARAMDGDLSYRRENGWTVFDLRLPSAQPWDAPIDSLPRSA